MCVFVRYVGIFGNADPLDISQWLSVDAPETPGSSSTGTWIDASSTCSHMVTGTALSTYLSYVVMKRIDSHFLVDDLLHLVIRNTLPVLYIFFW